jgi:hypothetical protein
MAQPVALSSEEREQVQELMDLPRPPSSWPAPSFFPSFDEDCDNFGFSWVTLNPCGDAEIECENGSRGGDDGGVDGTCRGSGGGQKPLTFQERLQADSVFHNPAALDLMLEAYAVPSHLSFAAPLAPAHAQQVEEGGWDYKTLQWRRHDYMSEEFTEKVRCY